MFSRTFLSICIFSVLLLNRSLTTTQIPVNPGVPVVVNLSPTEYQVNLTKFTCVIFYNSHAIGSCIIISKHFVVTTCRCLHKIAPGNTEVGWGEFRETLNAIVMSTSEIKNIYRNPDCFKTNTLVNPTADIAVVQTDREIVEGLSVEYASLPLRNTRHAWCQEAKRSMLLSNFRINHQVATTLSEAIWIVKTSIVRPRICLKLLGKDNFDMKDNICASYFHVGSFDRSCQMDYGSVLTRGEYVCGILAYKVNCG
ncbi:hypothetical protein ILUMI_15633, partial [Ignelater luminosus]